jgi:acetylglutamate kinase
MVMIRKPLMVMYGGSTIEDNHQLSILNDLYLYDYENLYWT